MERDSNKMSKKKKSEQQNLKLLHREYGAWSNMIYVLKNMIAYDKKWLFLILAGVISVPFTKYFWSFMSKFIIDMIIGEGSRRSLLWLIIGVALIRALFVMLNTYCESGVWWRYIAVRFRMQMKMNRKTMRIDFNYLEDPEVMDCYQKAQNACNSNSDGVEGMMHEAVGVLSSLAVVSAGCAILSTTNGVIVGLMFLIAVVNFFVMNHTNKVAKQKVWDSLAPWWRKRHYMQKTTTNFEEAKDIRMFGLRNWLLTKYQDLNLIRYNHQKINAKIWFCASVMSNLLSLLSQVFVYAWLVYSMAKGNMTVGNFSLYLTSSGTFFEYVSLLLTNIGNIFAKSRQVDDFRSFLDFDGGDNEEVGLKLPKLSAYEFTFENVSFKYPRAERYALKNLNLTLKAGERLAVVGLNGAGKSTMIKLLLRLYEPTEGRILLNGVDVKEYNKHSYYKAFAPVFQQVEVFAFPMEENVSMKEPGRTDSEKASKSLAAAGLSEKIAMLSAGIKTELLKVVDDDGVDLSGGEKQKLALARALYKDAPVVVLDEPTAALDALAEAKLYEDFDRLIGGKTAVYISHRLSSTQFCNNVAMFKNGEMVEYGTHADLLGKDGAYAELFRIQAQYYIEGVENVEGEVAYGEG